MPVRFRPWDPRRRFVCPVPASRRPARSGRPDGAEGERGLALRRVWIAVHAAPPDWGSLFARALDLMLVSAPRDGADALAIDTGAGRVAWRAGQRVTRITLELSGFSPRKRALIAAAIVKAARYA